MALRRPPQDGGRCQRPGRHDCRHPSLGWARRQTASSRARPLLLRPLPYAIRAVVTWNRSLVSASRDCSRPQYFDIRGSGTFADVALAIGGNDNLTGGGEPERIGTIRVSSNLLPMLGVRPLLGRLFTPEEDRAGAAGTALLGYGTWQRRYGGQASALGQSLIVNGVAFRSARAAGRSPARDVRPTIGGTSSRNAVPLQLGPDAPRSAPARTKVSTAAGRGTRRRAGPADARRSGSGAIIPPLPGQRRPHLGIVPSRIK